MKKIFSIFLIIWFLFIWKAFADVKPVEKVNLSIDSIETTNIKAETTSIKAETTNLEIPNPASVNCIENGWTSKIMEGKDWQYSLCVFENGTSCEEWAFFRVYAAGKQKRVCFKCVVAEICWNLTHGNCVQICQSKNAIIIIL